MIKVNLLKSDNKAAARPKGEAIEGELVLVSRDDAYKRLLLVLVFPLLLFGYEKMTIPSKQAEAAELSTMLSQLQEHNSKFENSYKEIQKFREDKQKLETKIGIIDSLSKDRLKDVKALDAIQSSVPEKAWLNSLDMIGNKMQLVGLAMSDADISLFMDNLSKSVYFKDVNLVSSVEQSTDTGVLKGFEINCLIESGQ